MFQADAKFLDSFERWKGATDLDTNSTITTGRPTGTKVFVRSNKYERGRAHIIIVNFDMKDSIPVDLSRAGLSPGQEFEIRDAQNYFGAPILRGTYTSASVNLPLNLTTVTPIVGASDPVNAAMTKPSHTSKEFNAFVVLPR
jgi:hypothetical protein